MSWFSEVFNAVTEPVFEAVQEVWEGDIDPYLDAAFDYATSDLAVPAAIADELSGINDPPERVTMDEWDYDYWGGSAEAAGDYTGGGGGWSGDPVAAVGNIIPDFGTIAGGAVAPYLGGAVAPYVMQTAGAMPMLGAAGAGLVSLGSKLARMFGARGASFTINGVKGSLASLWPMVRKYGPAGVATALGIGAVELGQLLMSAPTTARKRRRGISAGNIRTAKRVIRFNRSLSRSLGLNRGRSRAHAHPYYHRHR